VGADEDVSDDGVVTLFSSVVTSEVSGERVVSPSLVPLSTDVLSSGEEVTS